MLRDVRLWLAPPVAAVDYHAPSADAYRAVDPSHHSGSQANDDGADGLIEASGRGAGAPHLEFISHNPNLHARGPGIWGVQEHS